jgi:D-beta-D-heptose 7-phosphate kinase/D-beta-D-heptose 1-phosphate adenosyltransferase
MERAERWRRAGWRIGLIAGSAMADLPGVLAQARAWCDRLVVALHAADGRAKALAELAEVDLVTRFAGDSPVELIRLLRPDVLVQDPEHAPETVAGGEVVQEWGGEIRRPVIAADTLGA